MAMLWVHVFYSAVRNYGLFYIPGGDFGIYRSAAQAFVRDGPRAMYDPVLLAQHERMLMHYYGPDAHGLNFGPWVYPPVFILPFIVLTACPPIPGLLIWCLLSIGLACLVARGMAARLPERGFGLTASCVLFFPVGFTVFFGQVAMLFVYGLYRAYRCLERAPSSRGRVERNPLRQAAVRVVSGLGVPFQTAVEGFGRVGVGRGCYAAGLPGWSGRTDYGTISPRCASMSGFRDVPRITSPSLMINWRGVLAGFLPPDVSEGTGLALTLVLSIITTAVLFVIWRGAWDPRGDRFPAQMLATVIVMMLASFHNHIHSAAILLVPGMAVAARSSCPHVLNVILLAGLYAPLPLFFATASTRLTAWLIVALMLAALGTIFARELSAGRATFGTTSS